MRKRLLFLMGVALDQDESHVFLSTLNCMRRMLQ